MSLKSGLTLLKRSASDFMEDECPRMAAAMAYYTIFALPPLLILVLTMVSAIWDPQTIQRAMEGQFASMVGPDAAGQIHEILQNANRPGSGGPLATVLSVAALVFGATGAFVQLQDALNRAWEVAPDPEAGGIRSFLVKRVFSFGMILGVGFLLLVSLALSAVLAAFGEALAGWIPGLGPAILQAIDLIISFTVIALLFAAIFRILPDARIAWSDVWVGAAATAVLFIVGKFLIGLYLGRSDPGQAFGAAGSLAVLLIWIYYSGLLVLFGAEFTQRWAESRGHGIEPEEGAVRIARAKRRARPRD
jgi:membrane protein